MISIHASITHTKYGGLQLPLQVVIYNIVEALVQGLTRFAGRCEICVHSDLTYYVDHAERLVHDEYTRQHRPCRIW